VDRTHVDGMIVRYDQQTNVTTDLTTSAYGLGRPAVRYWFNTFLTRDDVALSYEKVVATNPYVYRIYLYIN
jgi:hypothetical protein